jgi:hypothetical protein
MTLELLTPDILKNIKPSRIEEYLLNHGWKEREKISNKASIWIKESSSYEGIFEILLPLNPEIPDFVCRVFEVIETLEVSERLSQLQIINELAEELTDVNQIAKQMNREVINFALSFPSNYGSEAPIASLGIILNSFQDTVNCIAQSLFVQDEIVNIENISAMDQRLSRNRISQNLSQEMELSAFGSFKGSFGLKLVSAPFGLFGNNLVVNSLKELVDLVGVSNDVVGLREHLFRLRSKSARKYVVFLKSLATASAGLDIEWGSTKANYGGHSQLTIENVQDALKVIREMKTESIQNIRLQGRITQGDVNTKHFKFENFQGMKYTGYIANEAMPISTILPLNKDCEVVMQETTTNFFITDKVDKTYKIIELSFTGSERVDQKSLFE